MWMPGGRCARRRTRGAAGWRKGSSPSHALDGEPHDVVHRDGFVAVEGLAVPGPDQRSVVRVLDGDQGVEILAGREDLAGARRAVELTGVAADGGHLPI